MVTTPATPRGKGNARRTPLEQAASPQQQTEASEQGEEQAAEDEQENSSGDAAASGSGVEAENEAAEQTGGQDDADDEIGEADAEAGPQRSVVLNIDTQHGDVGEMVRIPVAEADLLLRREAARPATKADFGL